MGKVGEGDRAGVKKEKMREKESMAHAEMSADNRNAEKKKYCKG